jgi:hypothetical protein
MSELGICTYGLSNIRSQAEDNHAALHHHIRLRSPPPFPISSAIFRHAGCFASPTPVLQIPLPAALEHQRPLSGPSSSLSLGRRLDGHLPLHRTFRRVRETKISSRISSNPWPSLQRRHSLEKKLHTSAPQASDIKYLTSNEASRGPITEHTKHRPKTRN